MAFTNSFSNPSEYRHAMVQSNDRMHEFRDQDGLSNPGSAEEPGLASFDEGTEKIDDFDPRLQNSARSLCLMEGDRLTENAADIALQQRWKRIERLTEHVEETTETIR